MASPFTLTLTLRHCAEHEDCVITTSDYGDVLGGRVVTHHHAPGEAIEYLAGMVPWIRRQPSTV